MTAAGFLSLVLAFLASATFLTLVLVVTWRFDRSDREPLRLVAGAVVWGAAIAPTISALVATASSSLSDVTWLHTSASAIVTYWPFPFIEEAAKALGLLAVIVFTNEFDSPTDGVVYGTAVGLGFAFTENAFYGLGSTTTPYDGTARGLVMIADRTATTAFLHAVCSGAFGGFLGHAMLTGRRLHRVAWTVAGIFAATALHLAWNLSLTAFFPWGEGGPEGHWTPYLPILAGLYLGVLGSVLWSERPILKRELEEEVEIGLAPLWVPEVIPYFCRRVRGDWWPSRAERTVISRLLTRLAFRKHVLRSLPTDRAAVASLEIVRLRQRVREVLGTTSQPHD